MTIPEKYPEHMPWDLEEQLDQTLDLKWMLAKGDNAYTFSRSRMNNEFIYIQPRHGRKKVVKEYLARFTYQRLFNEGYILAAVA